MGSLKPAKDLVAAWAYGDELLDEIDASIRRNAET
jgi:hypothetical protein